MDLETRSYARSPPQHAEPDTPPGVGWWLWVSDAHDQWWYPLRSELVHLGRSPRADVCFEHASVSRKHALLHRRDGAWWVYDDRPLNHVRVNGEQIENQCRLAAGDSIDLGASRVWLVWESDG